jgi:(2Fe-2S) ferredoxin
MPHRERYLFVCTNRRKDDDPRGSCAQKGSEEIVATLKKALKEAGVADRVRACSSSCLDMCETGVSIVQEPEHVAYGNVRMEDVGEIVEAAAKGEVVEHLLVARPAKKGAE